jgi:uncharacterized protein YecT (DUF1311 family)
VSRRELFDRPTASGRRAQYQAETPPVAGTRVVLALVLFAVSNGAPARSPIEECTDRSPTVAGIGACLDEMLEQAEDELWVQSKAVLAQMRQLQKQAGSRSAVRAFGAAEKQFHAYRMAQCAWAATRAGAKQASERQRTDCLIRLTRERSLELAGLLPAAAGEIEDKAAAQPSAGVQAQALFDVEWRLVRLIKSGQEQALSPESRLILVLTEGGGVTGSTRASIYSGRYALRPPNRLEWLRPGFSIERVSGQFDMGDPDEAILDELAGTTKLWLEATGLRLQNDSGSLSLVFGR